MLIGVLVEAISRAVHAGKTGITVQDLEAARTYENVMDIKMLMVEAGNKMRNAMDNWWMARNR